MQCERCDLCDGSATLGAHVALGLADAQRAPPGVGTSCAPHRPRARAQERRQTEQQRPRAAPSCDDARDGPAAQSAAAVEAARLSAQSAAAVQAARLSAQSAPGTHNGFSATQNGVSTSERQPAGRHPAVCDLRTPAQHSSELKVSPKSAQEVMILDSG